MQIEGSSDRLARTLNCRLTRCLNKALRHRCSHRSIYKYSRSTTNQRYSVTQMVWLMTITHNASQDGGQFRSAFSHKQQGIQDFFFDLPPRVGPGYPLSAFSPSLSIHVLIFCSFLLFFVSFSHSLYLFSSIVHSFPFYQNYPTLFPGPEVVGGDRTWV